MMTHRQALEVLATHRQDRLVITTMGSVGVWPSLSDTPLDFAYLPSSMGQGISLGLGLAIAQPHRGVVVVMGDGSLLMNLGSLVTVTQHMVPLTILLMENGFYEVTGGQVIVGSRRTDFLKLAEGAGIPHCYRFDAQDTWQQQAKPVLAHKEPTFVSLIVEGTRGQKTPSAPRPMSEQIQRLQEALGIG